MKNIKGEKNRDYYNRNQNTQNVVYPLNNEYKSLAIVVNAE